MAVTQPADVDSDTLIRKVSSELKPCKAPGFDNGYNQILKKAICTSFYTHLAQTFTLSLTLFGLGGGGQNGLFESFC